MGQPSRKIEVGNIAKEVGEDKVEIIVNKYIGLALSLARKYSSYCTILDLDELQSAAMHGLWKGAAKSLQKKSTEKKTFTITYKSIDWTIRDYIRMEQEKRKRRVDEGFNVISNSVLVGDDLKRNEYKGAIARDMRTEEIPGELWKVAEEEISSRSDKALEVFNLLFKEEKTLYEIRDELGITRQAVCSRRDTALRCLRESSRIQEYTGKEQHEPKETEGSQAQEPKTNVE